MLSSHLENHVGRLGGNGAGAPDVGRVSHAEKEHDLLPILAAVLALLRVHLRQHWGAV